MEGNGVHMQKEVCKGECLFGKCPYPSCVKYATGNREAVKTNEKMSIMTDIALPAHSCDKNGYGIVVDIGTTTVVLYVYSLRDSKVLAVQSEINSQTSFGLDVISRIKFCGDDPKGLSLMHEAITKQLNEMIGKACAAAGVLQTDIVDCVITANTTMLHLLCNLSPVSMGVLPFEPLSYFGETIRAKEIGIELETGIYLPPCISSFVGGDITTDMLACGFADSKEYLLLMDIGTNGEVALGNKERILSSSTAAGPAFEGAHISCGMAGVKGAINKVYTMRGRLEVETIGGEPARGICGSGLLDAIAVFVKAGAIDETGRIAEEENRFITEVDGEPALKIADEIIVTQKDIREVQTAKAAVSAGVETLIHEMGIDKEEIKQVYIAGGFGNFMDVESARAVGLIPADLPTQSVGNAAAAGASLVLLDDSFQQKAAAVKDVSGHTELGNNPFFMEKYVDNMYF
ncbi:ASKHA domain-containing protein [Christensenellaceae bacterium OttesenSCG-928-K19]|nr:ASKHA domain-containing protein [Christensenellaceae bacterium OttesenSCG-928-K19]